MKVSHSVRNFVWRPQTRQLTHRSPWFSCLSYGSCMSCDVPFTLAAIGGGQQTGRRHRGRRRHRVQLQRRLRRRQSRRRRLSPRAASSRYVSLGGPQYPSGAPGHVLAAVARGRRHVRPSRRGRRRVDSPPAEHATAAVAAAAAASASIVAPARPRVRLLGLLSVVGFVERGEEGGDGAPRRLRLTPEAEVAGTAARPLSVAPPCFSRRGAAEAGARAPRMPTARHPPPQVRRRSRRRWVRWKCCRRRRATALLAAALAAAATDRQGGGDGASASRVAGDDAVAVAVGFQSTRLRRGGTRTRCGRRRRCSRRR